MTDTQRFWAVLLVALGLVVLATALVVFSLPRPPGPGLAGAPAEVADALRAQGTFGPQPDEARPRQQPPGLTVGGEGEARAEPDIAIVSVGATHVAPTAQEAMREVSERMAAVIASAKGHGLQDKDVQTSGLSLQPIFRPRPGADTRPPEIQAYRAGNNVTLTVRDLSRASAVLDSAVSSGANVVGGLRFALSDPAQLRLQALRNAVESATRAGQEMASAAGVRIVGVQSIAEEGGPTPVPRPAAEAAALRAGVDAAPPVEPGEMLLRARVRVTFLIA